MAEGGVIKNSSDLELESSSNCSVRGVDGDTLCKTLCGGKADENISYYCKDTENSEGDDTPKSDVCSVSILSVTGANDTTFVNNNSDTLNSSFLSVTKDHNDITRIMVRTLDLSTFNKEERSTEVTGTNRSGDKELLCHICISDEIRCKATHTCSICGIMCCQCLRYHEKFTNHQESVISLSKYTENFDKVGGYQENKANETTLPQDESFKIQPSKIEYFNILSNGDSHACSTIDLAQMSNGNLMVADFGNKCLKIFYFDTLSLKDAFDLEDYPVSITCFPDDVVAVAYIDTISLETFDNCHKTLSVYCCQGGCKGLKNVNYNLYSLEGDPNIVSIYQLQGYPAYLELVHIINLDECDIKNPEQIDIDTFGDKIYIMDASLHLYVLNKIGNKLTKLPLLVQNGVSPEGQKNVYICYFDRNEVVVINQQSLSNENVLSDKRLVRVPFSVLYDRKGRRLFIGMFKTNFGVICKFSS